MKSRLYFLFVLFFLAIIAVDTQAQIVVTVPSPGCNAPGTYTENGTLNGKPRYLGPGDFPYEIVWLNTHWECHFPNNTALRFVNMNDTPLPPCGQWPRGDGAPCGQAFMTVTSVNGTPCPVACPDDDMDEICNNMDNCPNTPNNGQADTDNDGVGDACDGCPNDPNKTSPGTCGCGVADTDSDNDSTPDCNDGCPNDPNKIAPGICGCGVADDDADMDGYYACEDCNDNDANVNPGSSPAQTNVVYHNTNSVTVYWGTIAGSTNYGLRYRIEGSNELWVEGTSLRAYRRLFSLQACTDYEVQYRNFKNGAWNCWSESYFFTTPCARVFNPGNTKGSTESGMQIFPNPTSDVLNIVLDENMLDKAATLTLRDQLGRAVWNQQIEILETTLVELNVRKHNLTAGVYMLSLQNENGVTTQQVVVSR